MPRSRATSPSPWGADISNSFVPGVILTPNTPEHQGNTSTSTVSTSNASSQVRSKKQKYMKPRIGTYFQAKVEPFSESVAKTTVELREAEKKKGTLGGYRNHNCDSIVGGEYWDGGLFASMSTNLTNGGYGFGGGIATASSNGGGRRKRAGRPPKNGKGSKVSLFNNNQPIYYDSDIRPPSGGLCIHRPIQSMHEDDRRRSQNEFLTFARNIILQSPTSKEMMQTHGQFSTQNLATFSYKRVEFLFNDLIERYDKNNQTLQSKQHNDGPKKGQKRKADHLSSKDDTSTINTTPGEINNLISKTSKTTNIVATTSTVILPPNEDSSVSEDQQYKSNTNKESKAGLKSSNRATLQTMVSDTLNAADTKPRKRPYYDAALGLEEDERFLEFLQHGHQGNVQRAKFYMLAQLSQGRAVKTRRHMKKLKKEDEMNVPLSAVLAPLSDSWRRRYERLGVSSTVLGDHRSPKSRNEYPFFDMKKEQKLCIDNQAEMGEDCKRFRPELSYLNPWSKTFNKEEAKQNSNDADDKLVTNSLDLMSKKSNAEEYKFSTLSYNDLEGHKNDKHFIENWKSILRIGQHMTSLLVQSEATSNENPCNVKLHDVLIILARAHSLPKLEEIFGKRDSISKQISQCLNNLLDNVEVARGVVAHISDAMYDKNDEGVDIKKLSKIIDSKSSRCSLHVEEIEIVRQMLNESREWESKLSTPDISENNDEVDCYTAEDLNLPQQSLANAEELAFCGRSLSLQPQSLSLLDERIQRAYELRNRIRDWTNSKNNANDKDSVKYVASMIKEANLINLGFPELSILSKVHKDAEEWVDRASIAMRSKISLQELERLVHVGKKLPLGLAATLDKLTTRYEEACSWVTTLNAAVPSPMEQMDATGSNLDANHLNIWLKSMLESLKCGEKLDELIELAAQGSRLPVEINILQLLQVAIDSKNWSAKGGNWLLGSDPDCKKGKIDDLRDHVHLADTIVEKVEQLTGRTGGWHLEYFNEIKDIVVKSEKWYDMYRDILENDNRRINNKCVMTFSKLREIVESAKTIDVNLGAPFTKVNRMFNEAKIWIENFHHLLSNCGIIVVGNESGSLPLAQSHKVSLEQAAKAIEAASSHLSVELEEVNQLKSLVNKSQDWFDRAIQFAPRRNKRIVKGKKDVTEKKSMDEVIQLIDMAPKIPMDTTEDLGRLRMLLSDVQSWRLQAQVSLREISHAFDLLREERIRYYGAPDKFLQDVNPSVALVEPVDCETKRSDQNGLEQNEQDSSGNDKVGPKEPTKMQLKAVVGSGGKDVYKMIATLMKSAETIPINTFEEKVSEQLGKASKWCKKVAILIASHNDVYTNKRWKKDLDVLMSEGDNLQLLDTLAMTLTENDVEEKKLLQEVKKSLSLFISNDIDRLKILRLHRDKFYTWCDKVTKTYSECDKKVPLEVLKSLAEESAVYPQNAETVKQIRKDASSAELWAKSVGDVISSGKKISLVEAKNKLDAGTRLKFICNEFKELKKSYLAAKAWSKRVKKSGLNEGSAQIFKIKELIREHDSFLIEMPEEIDALKSAMCSYCICRRPYEGFMIGCDECEDWFHGSCMGVSQAQGNRIDKYLCIRCCVKKVHKMSSNSIATIIRKWCDPKELSKSRSQDSQKHQRKIREKKREIGKWKEDLQNNITKLRELKAEEIRQLSLNSNPHQAPVEQQSSSPLSPKITEVNGNIVKATTTLEQCNRRLQELAALSEERKSIQEKEDSMRHAFRYWCLQLRSTVLTPDTKELSEASCPTPSLASNTTTELLSTPMTQMISMASNYGINEFSDTIAVKNCFECISWSHLALSILKRRPTLEEIKSLVNLSSQLKLPEVKSIGMMRSMISRTASWQAKATKALVSDKKNTCTVASLNDLRVGMNGTPLYTKQETLLMNVIENGGLGNGLMKGGEEGGVDLDDISPHAPDLLRLWPPFGLSNSAEALKALGIIPLTLKYENLQVPVHPSKVISKTPEASALLPNSIHAVSQSPTRGGTRHVVKPTSIHVQTKTRDNNNRLSDSILNASKVQQKNSANSNVEHCSILNTNQAAADAVAAALSVDPQFLVNSTAKPSNLKTALHDMKDATNDNKNSATIHSKNIINAEKAVEVAVKAALANSGMMFKAAATTTQAQRSKILSPNKLLSKQPSIESAPNTAVNITAKPSQVKTAPALKTGTPLLQTGIVNKTSSIDKPITIDGMMKTMHNVTVKSAASVAKAVNIPRTSKVNINASNHSLTGQKISIPKSCQPCAKPMIVVKNNVIAIPSSNVKHSSQPHITESSQNLVKITNDVQLVKTISVSAPAVPIKRVVAPIKNTNLSTSITVKQPAKSATIILPSVKSLVAPKKKDSPSNAINAPVVTKPPISQVNITAPINPSSTNPPKPTVSNSVDKLLSSSQVSDVPINQAPQVNMKISNGLSQTLNSINAPLQNVKPAFIAPIKNVIVNTTGLSTTKSVPKQMPQGSLKSANDGTVANSATIVSNNTVGRTTGKQSIEQQAKETSQVKSPQQTSVLLKKFG